MHSDLITLERLRLARELHDGIAQDLSAMGYLLDSVIGRSSLDAGSRERLRELRGEITRTIDEIRDEIFDLRNPRELEPIPRLRSYLTRIFSDSTFSWEIVCGEEASLSPDLIKVLVELARNALAHSTGDHLRISIETELISVTDNGVGEINFNSTRFGMIGLIERVERAGYHLRYEPATRLIWIEKIGR